MSSRLFKIFFGTLLIMVGGKERENWGLKRKRLIGILSYWDVRNGTDAFSPLLQRSAPPAAPAPSLCFRVVGQRGDGFPTAVHLASGRRAGGGQMRLAWTLICESPVTGPTCQIKPTPALSRRAAGVCVAPALTPVTSPPSL